MIRGFIRGYANAHGISVGGTHHYVGVNVKRLPNGVRVEIHVAAGRRSQTFRWWPVDRRGAS